MNFCQSWQVLYALYGTHFILDPYLQPWTSAALAAGAQAGFTINCPGDSATLVLGISHEACTTLAAAGGVLPQHGDFTLELETEGRQWQNGAIISTLYGSPFYLTVLANGNIVAPQETTLPFPKSIKPGGYITGRVTNGNLANNIVRLVFHCVQLFERAPGKSPTNLRQQLMLER